MHVWDGVWIEIPDSGSVKMRFPGRCLLSLSCCDQEQTILYWEMHIHTHLPLGISRPAHCPGPVWREGPFHWHCSSLVIFLLWSYYPKDI